MLRGAVILAAVIAAAALAAGFAAWRHPLAIFEWQSRRALTGAGLAPHDLAVPAGRLHYFEGGQGRPLLLLHGAGDQAGNWSEVARELARSHRVVVPDLPGHGASDPRQGVLPLPVVVEGLEALLASRPAGERVTIVGNSLGAWMAMVLARAAPERVERIVLVNGGGIVGDPTVNLVPRTREEARALLDRMTDPGSRRIPDNVLDDIVRRGPTGGVARMGLAGASMFPYLMDGKLKDFPVPVDLLWGASDRVMPLDYARRMAAELPRVRLNVVPRCGHVPLRECPGPFTAALRDLLAQPVPAAPVLAREVTP